MTNSTVREQLLQDVQDPSPCWRTRSRWVTRYNTRHSTLGQICPIDFEQRSATGHRRIGIGGHISGGGGGPPRNLGRYDRNRPATARPPTPTRQPTTRAVSVTRGRHPHLTGHPENLRGSPPPASLTGPARREALPAIPVPSSPTAGGGMERCAPSPPPVYWVAERVYPRTM